MIRAVFLKLLSLATAALVTVSVTIATASCSSDSTPDIVYGNDSEIFPSDSLTDWISYASQISVVTVISESKMPVPLEVRDAENGGGYIGRNLNLSVDETLWTYPGTNPQTGTISLVANGWLRKGEVTVPYGSYGAERLEVGRSYIIPLVLIERGWAWLSATAILPITSDKRIAVDAERITNPVSQSLNGMNFAQLTQRLANTASDPIAARYAHLPPDQRIQAVYRDLNPRFEIE